MPQHYEPGRHAQSFHLLKHGEENLVMSANRDELDSLLPQAFAEGVRWPIDRPSRRALAHLGLTVPQIARYFSVDPVEVQALLKPSR